MDAVESTKPGVLQPVGERRRLRGDSSSAGAVAYGASSRRFCVVVVVVAIVVVVTSVKVAVPKRGGGPSASVGVGGADRSTAATSGRWRRAGRKTCEMSRAFSASPSATSCPAVASNDAISARTAGSLGRAPRASSSLRSRYIRSKALSAAAALGRAGALRGPVQFIADHHARGSAISAIDGVAEGPSSIGASGAGAATIGEEERRYSEASEVHRPGVDGSSSIDDAVPSYVSSADGRKGGGFVGGDSNGAGAGSVASFGAGLFVAEPPHGRCSRKSHVRLRRVVGIGDFSKNLRHLPRNIGLAIAVAGCAGGFPGRGWLSGVSDVRARCSTPTLAPCCAVPS